MLTDDDYITSTHRGHGHVIAKGTGLDPMMAELFGKKTGYCKGKGGSMHIADLDLGIMGANGIVGGGPPLAAGAGLACQYLDNGSVAVCFFGDGASNAGSFHESLNIAARWKLPVIYVIENNQYGMGGQTCGETMGYTIAARVQYLGQSPSQRRSLPSATRVAANHLLHEMPDEGIVDIP